jgi:hypothetical protein
MVPSANKNKPVAKIHRQHFWATVMLLWVIKISEDSESEMNFRKTILSGNLHFYTMVNTK